MESEGGEEEEVRRRTRGVGVRGTSAGFAANDEGGGTVRRNEAIGETVRRRSTFLPILYLAEYNCKFLRDVGRKLYLSLDVVRMHMGSRVMVGFQE